MGCLYVVYLITHGYNYSRKNRDSSTQKPNFEIYSFLEVMHIRDTSKLFILNLFCDTEAVPSELLIFLYTIVKVALKKWKKMYHLNIRSMQNLPFENYEFEKKDDTLNNSNDKKPVLRERRDTYRILKTMYVLLLHSKSLMLKTVRFICIWFKFFIMDHLY